MVYPWLPAAFYVDQGDLELSDLSLLPECWTHVTMPGRKCGLRMFLFVSFSTPQESMFCLGN